MHAVRSSGFGAALLFLVANLAEEKMKEDGGGNSCQKASNCLKNQPQVQVGKT